METLSLARGALSIWPDPVRLEGNADVMSAKPSTRTPMEQYLLSMYQPEGKAPAPEFLKRVMDDVDRLRRELQAGGARLFGGGLQPSTTATVVRIQGSEMLMTDGPPAEGKEHIGGFAIIKALDLDSALEWGRKYARATTLPIEVRPFRGEAEN